MPRLFFLLIVTMLSAAALAQPVDHSAERYRLVSQEDEVISVLQNGMTVIVRHVPSPVVSVRGYVKTGGIYEGRWLGGGLSHLLEHLVAGGSTRTRTESESRELLQQIGNVSNAYTTYDHTGYFINTTPEHLDQAVDLLLDWLLGALITDEEYEREYEVVQRELEQGRGQPRRQFWYLSVMNRYRVHPMRVPIIGYQEVIRGLTADDVREYYRLTYRPNNMLISIAGDLDVEQTLLEVRRHVADAPPGREFIPNVPQEPPVLAPRTIVATFPRLGQAQLELAFPSVRLDHPDLYALDVLATILGWGEGSMLVEELRDRLRLVSSISAFNWTPHYAEGTFAIGATLPPEQILETSAAVFELIERIKSEGVDEERLERAKTQTRAERVKGQQTAEAIAGSLARDLLSTGDPHFTDRYVERIQEVTAEQVQQMAIRYLDRGRLLTTVMFPEEYVDAEGLPRAVDLIRPVAPTVEENPPDVVSPITRHQLEGGTILLHKRITTTPLVAIQMFSLGGLTAEDRQTNGIGNLTMQMLPRGTTTRSAAEIASFFDARGADLSTACGNNSWYSQVLCLSEDVAEVMEVYADILTNPAFPEDELEIMRQRTIAQIEAQDAEWSGQAMRFFRSTYFGPLDSPYQFLPIGQRRNLEEFAGEHVRQWYFEHVLPSRRVLVVFGDIELDQARELAEQHFANLPEMRDREVPSPAAGAHQMVRLDENSPQLTVQRIEVQQTPHPVAGVIIGFRSDSVIGRPVNDPLTIANTMASGYRYPTGYLHETLRGRGLVYVVHATNWPGRSPEYPGTFFVYAGCDPERVNEVVELILENIARLQGSKQDMQPGWFERSKRLIITSDALEKETAADQAMQAALDELYGLGYEHHERFAERIEAVPLSWVRGAAATHLREAVVTISTPRPEQVEIDPGPREYEEFHPVDLTPRGVEHDPAGAVQ